LAALNKEVELRENILARQEEIYKTASKDTKLAMAVKDGWFFKDSTKGVENNLTQVENRVIEARSKYEEVMLKRNAKKSELEQQNIAPAVLAKEKKANLKRQEYALNQIGKNISEYGYANGALGEIQKQIEVTAKSNLAEATIEYVNAKENERFLATDSEKIITPEEKLMYLDAQKTILEIKIAKGKQPGSGQLDYEQLNKDKTVLSVLNDKIKAAEGFIRRNDSAENLTAKKISGNLEHETKTALQDIQDVINPSTKEKGLFETTADTESEAGTVREKITQDIENSLSILEGVVGSAEKNRGVLAQSDPLGKNAEESVKLAHQVKTTLLNLHKKAKNDKNPALAQRTEILINAIDGLELEHRRANGEVVIIETPGVRQLINEKQGKVVTVDYLSQDRQGNIVSQITEGKLKGENIIISSFKANNLREREEAVLPYVKKNPNASDDEVVKTTFDIFMESRFGKEDVFLSTRIMDKAIGAAEWLGGEQYNMRTIAVEPGAFAIDWLLGTHFEEVFIGGYEERKEGKEQREKTLHYLTEVARRTSNFSQLEDGTKILRNGLVEVKISPDGQITETRVVLDKEGLPGFKEGFLATEKVMIDYNAEKYQITDFTGSVKNGKLVLPYQKESAQGGDLSLEEEVSLMNKQFRQDSLSYDIRGPEGKNIHLANLLADRVEDVYLANKEYFSLKSKQKSDIKTKEDDAWEHVVNAKSLANEKRAFEVEWDANVTLRTLSIPYRSVDGEMKQEKKWRIFNKKPAINE
ncbi:hypothetical protein KKA69_00455, partial [Patescibacteria group bacterium]|nr:hypothetical protein [Patescibacteria group bacterium]